MVKDTRKLPIGFKEDWIRFTIGAVGAEMVATQMTGMKTGTEYILKDVEVMFSDPGMDAYLDINTVNTDAAATKIGGRYYQTLSAIHWDGETNGPIGAQLTAKPYLQLCAGAGKSAQTVYVTLHYYYK